MPVEVQPADIDESTRDGEAPEAYVARLARAKATAIARRSGRWVLVSAVHGSVTNVAGLPLAEVIAALREAGAPPPRFTAGNPA